MGNDVTLGLDLLPKELKLLLLFMAKESREVAFSDYEELFKDVNWELFVQLTRHHRVYPYICHQLKQLDPTVIPSSVIQKLDRETKKTRSICCT